MNFRDEVRARLPKLCAARDRGSLTAAVRLQCLECTGGSKAEVQDCTDKGCPLYLVRPYKTAAEEAALQKRERSAAQVAAAQQAGERLKAAAQAKKASCHSPQDPRLPGGVCGGEGQDPGGVPCR